MERECQLFRGLSNKCLENRVAQEPGRGYRARTIYLKGILDWVLAGVGRVGGVEGGKVGASERSGQDTC